MKSNVKKKKYTFYINLLDLPFFLLVSSDFFIIIGIELNLIVEFLVILNKLIVNI